MKITYEGSKFEISFFDSYQRVFLRRSVKRKVARTGLVRYRQDSYLSLCEELLSGASSGLILDVGANVGFTAIPIAQRFPNLSVIAIEPHPIAAGQFMKNLRLNELSNLKLISAAIGNDSTLAQIYSCPSNSGGNRLSGFAGRADLSGQRMESVTVPTVSLKSVLESVSEDSSCELLKIDTEGYEFEVLRSLGDGLNSRKIKTIVAEYGPEGLRSANSTGKQLLELMSDSGYCCNVLQTGSEIDTAGDLPNLSDFAVIDLVFTRR